MDSSTATLKITHFEALHVGKIDLTLFQGECMGLSGPSGCGKSILLKAIADLIDSNGSLSLEGADRNDFDATIWRKEVQLVPAESLWWKNTVGEHFKDPLFPERLSPLSLAPDIANQPINQLSTGQKQRLALLRSLELKPTVLLLDEPTASLDRDNTLQAEQLILQYLKNNNASAIWVSHDPEQLKRVASRCVAMQNGQLKTVTHDTH